jgi:hypothetical protein
MEAVEVVIELSLLPVKLVPVIVDLPDIVRSLPDHLNPLNLGHHVGKDKCFRLMTGEQNK